MENKKIEEMETKTFTEDDSPQVPPPDIIAYNELRSCADLFRMKKTGILDIQPDFQREVVWRNPDQTRFIDSLIKQLPIPSMCFSLDYKTQRWQVIDGLQRMSTICRLLSGESWNLSELDDIDPQISGKPASDFHDLNSPLNQFLLRVENLSLPVTVLRCDYDKRTHTRYLFTIFHRLNTGGMKLNNQEIRNCIYSGDFNRLLKELNGYADWKHLLRLKSARGNRFTKEELILRVFAFLESVGDYEGRLAAFLNDYMAAHRNPAAAELDLKRTIFKRTVSMVYNVIYEGKPPSKQPISILESLLVGVAANIDHLETKPKTDVRSRLQELLNQEEFSEAKLSEGLSAKQRVTGRINAARQIFAK